jgi:hypothetical protein
MKPDIPQVVAVMSIEAGEEFFGGWATPRIPQVGIYKLLAKKKADGTMEWAHFVQRDNGLKESVLRGTVKTLEEFAVVSDAVNSNLRRIFGVALQAAEYDARTLEGKKVPDVKH